MTVLTSVFVTDTDKENIPANTRDVFRKIQEPYEIHRFQWRESSVTFWIIQKKKRRIRTLAWVKIVLNPSKGTCCMTSSTTKRLENPVEVIVFLSGTLKKVFPSPKKKASPK